MWNLKIKQNSEYNKKETLRYKADTIEYVLITVVNNDTLRWTY